jgi:hypothetical protein
MQCAISLTEQTKITSFLSKLGGKIGSVGEQMRQAQAWKKELLQQMFV